MIKPKVLLASSFLLHLLFVVLSLLFFIALILRRLAEQGGCAGLP
jgi:hypothetical protein